MMLANPAMWRYSIPMQTTNIYHDLIAKITQLQSAVNNLIAANTQSGTVFGSNLISSGDISALTNAMTTLQADKVVFRNTIPTIVAGN